MVTVRPGFSRPRQIRPFSRNVEHIIADACPGSIIEPWQAASRRHPLWGLWRRVLTGHATDEDLRHRASSGGAISALLIEALTSGMVERVLHIGADPLQPMRNIVRWSDTPDEIIDGAGSRYAASSPMELIGPALAAGKRFAFVGKPCDVSALRRLAKHDPRVDKLVPVVLSFFCGGVPSHDGADRIVRAMGLEPDEIESFRYRGNGWPGLTRAQTRDGRSGEMRYAESWGEYLSGQVQFRCKICPDSVGGVADIACADAWYGAGGGFPEFEEAAGRSLMITRTPQGEILLDKALESGVLAAEPFDIDDVELMQPAQSYRKRHIAARVAANSSLLQPSPRMRGLDVIKAGRSASWRELFRNFAGTARRIAMGRR
ncbi:MAG: Coenzyme F420 hydrogenase/dehydrogenase, beta subunit C-terminal domain [Pseudomonadota bacterium]